MRTTGSHGHSGIRLRVGLALAVVVMGLPLSAQSETMAAFGGTGSSLTGFLVDRPDEEVMLFALRLDQTTLNDTFPGFPVKDGYIVPLGELCRQLDLAIQVDPTRGLAEGFFLEERRRFRLDVLAGTVAVNGEAQSLDRSLIELHADDIYVDTRLIARWLPLDLQLDKRSATLTVVPREPLPLQLRWKRERESGRAFSEEGTPQKFNRMEAPYRLLEIPFVDETLRVTARSEQGGGPRLQAQSSTYASGDLLYLSTSLYAILDNHDGLSEFRATAGRRDPNGELLGPLHATEFAFGEVLNPGVNLLSFAYAGTGALLSNFPLERENAFDRQSFQGDLPPGWQVEVYRNQALIGFQASRPDGRFEFLGIPLFYGWNDFRLVFYGPQGQRREEVVRFDVSESQTPAGSFQYRLMGNEPRNAGRRAQVEGKYGFSKQVSANFAVTDVDLDGVRHGYTEAGLQGFWRPLSASLTAARDTVGGSIAELSLRTRLGPVSLTGKHAQLGGGFVSEVFRPVHGLVQSRNRLELSALLPSLERSLFTLDLGGTQDQLVAGGEVNQVYNRLSTSYKGYFLSNQITRTEGRGGMAAFPATTQGDLLASKFFKNLSLRGQVNYQLSGGRRLNAVALTGETQVWDLALLRAGITRTVLNGDTLYQLGANKAQGTFSCGVDLSYSTRSHWMLDITLRAGFGREPRQMRWSAQAQSMASYGAVSAQAFLDSNGNGVRDGDEKPMDGVGFQVNGAPHPAKSDGQGVALLNNLSPSLDANISVAPASLEDPLMRPSLPGIRVTPRQGHVMQVDFPLLIFGEITGTVFLKQGGVAKAQPGVRVELVDAAGKVVLEVRSAYDGFYDLSAVPPGEYLLRVPEAEAKRMNATAPAPRRLQMKTEGSVLDGLDLVLEASADLLPAPLRSEAPDPPSPLKSPSDVHP